MQAIAAVKLESLRLSPESWIQMFTAGLLTYTFLVCLPINLRLTVTLQNQKTLEEIRNSNPEIRKEEGV